MNNAGREKLVKSLPYLKDWQVVLAAVLLRSLQLFWRHARTLGIDNQLEKEEQQNRVHNIYDEGEK